MSTAAPQWGTTVPGTYDVGLATAFVNNSIAAMSGAITGESFVSDDEVTFKDDLRSLSDFAMGKKPPEGYDPSWLQGPAARFGIEVSGYDPKTDSIPRLKVNGGEALFNVPRRDVPEKPGKNFAAAVRETISGALVREAAMIDFQGPSYADKLGLLGGFMLYDVEESGIADKAALKTLFQATRNSLIVERYDVSHICWGTEHSDNLTRRITLAICGAPIVVAGASLALGDVGTVVTAVVQTIIALGGIAVYPALYKAIGKFFEKGTISNRSTLLEGLHGLDSPEFRQLLHSMGDDGGVKAARFMEDRRIGLPTGLGKYDTRLAGMLRQLRYRPSLIIRALMPKLE